MAVQRSTHPSPDVLKAFALGKLNDSSSDAVMSHLDSCPDCFKQVTAQSGDDFLNRLRQAHGSSSTPAPAKSLGDVARAPQPPAGRTPVPKLPPELAANQQYEILRELGRGGMGVVYLAKNKLLDRLEVLKVVNKALLDRPGAVERFLREIRSAAKLSHANVVTAHSAVQQGELLAFAMEYVEGQDLASLVKAQGPLPIPNACFYVQQAAWGLQHAFEKGLVHRDIKPQNLILAREGKKHIVKVLDFGLAKVMREKKEDTGLTGEGKMLGTPDYIAPEQSLDAAKADIRADIYSLGCTLYYLLSGRPPFSANSLGAILMAHQMEEAKPLNLVRPEVPEELAAVVRKMMAKSPAKRYQTPLEVVQALAPFVKQGAMPKPSPELSSGAAEAKPAVEKAARVDTPPPPVAEAAKKPAVKKASRPDMSPAPVAAVPPKQPPSASVWESLTEDSIASVGPRKSVPMGKRGAASRMPGIRKNWLIGGGLGVGVLLLVLVGMWAISRPDVKVKTADGEAFIVLANLPADAEVLVDGERVTVTWGSGGKQAETRVKPGTHKVEVKKKDGLRLEVKKDGLTVEGKELTFKDGDREIFTVRVLPAEDEKRKKREANAGDKRPGEKWIQEVAALPAASQIKAVADKLRERNPGFVGELEPTIENGCVTGLKFLIHDVTDLSPLRALPALKSLSCFASNERMSKLADLTPLQGLPLHFLYISHSAVSDLSPLSAIKELQHLEILVSPLTDLKPLEGLKLRELILHETRVEDLSPLKGMPLRGLNIHRTRVKDLSPLEGMKLEWFVYLQQPVKDISVLKDMPLRSVECRFQRARDEAVLRSIKALETINGKPAAEFWKEVDSTITPGGSATKTSRSDYDDLAEGRWVAVLPSVEVFNRLLGEKAYRWTEPKYVDGTLECSGRSRLFFPSVQAKDAIVRTRTKRLGPKNGGNVSILFRNAKGETVAAWFNGDGFFGIGGLKNNEWKDLTSRELQEHYDDYFEFAFAVVGDNRIAYVNGRKILETRDDAPFDRPVFVEIGTSGDRKGLFQNIEFQVLDKSSAVEDKGFVSLFNGKDLKDWRTHPKQRGNWHVEKGVLIGSGPATSHLYSIRGNYKNFHLRVEARINDRGNSGIYFRAPFGPIVPPNNPTWPQGYEAQINATHGDPRKTGSLIGKVQVSEAPHKPNEWFMEEVIAQGNHLVIKVNGRKTADNTDDKRLFTSGHVALQQADAATVVEFRKIEIKELPANPVSPEAKKTEAEPKPSGGTQRAKRIDRWGMQWDVKNSREYVAQLRGLGAILAIPVREDANGPEYEIVRDLSARPAKLIKEEIKEIQRKEFWIDDKPDSVQGVMSVLGLRLRPSHFIAIFTEEVEEKLLRLEIDYLKQRHPGRGEDDIALTKFSLKVKGGKYVPEVVEQRLK